MHCQLSVQIFLPKVGQSLLEKDSPVSILSSLCWLESPFLGDRWERWNLPPVHFKPTSGLFSVSSYFQALSSNSRLRCSPCKRIWISSATPPPPTPQKKSKVFIWKFAWRRAYIFDRILISNAHILLSPHSCHVKQCSWIQQSSFFNCHFIFMGIDSLFWFSLLGHPDHLRPLWKSPHLRRKVKLILSSVFMLLCGLFGRREMEDFSMMAMRMFF